MGRAWQSAVILVDVQSLFHLGQHLIDAEASWLHARREFHEGVQKLPDDVLRGISQVCVIKHPIPIGVGGDIRPFERVSA